jgi:hypothetical protein
MRPSTVWIIYNLNAFIAYLFGIAFFIIGAMLASSCKNQ